MVLVCVVCDGPAFKLAYRCRHLVCPIAVRPFSTGFEWGYEIGVCGFVEVDVRGYVQGAWRGANRRGGICLVFARRVRSKLHDFPVELQGDPVERSWAAYALRGVHVFPIEGGRSRSGEDVFFRVPSGIFDVYAKTKDGGDSIFSRGRAF